jgi:hypothetical protein
VGDFSRSGQANSINVVMDKNGSIKYRMKPLYDLEPETEAGQEHVAGSPLVGYASSKRKGIR